LRLGYHYNKIISIYILFKLILTKSLELILIKLKLKLEVTLKL